MRALVFEHRLARLVTTRLLAALTPRALSLLTHRFPLARWREALLACHDQGRSGALKVLFEFPPGAASPV